jgi:hypothetical protein
MRKNKAVLVLLAVAQLTCNQAILTAPPGSSMFLTANPLFIPANGGVSVVTAFLLEPAGTPVSDGTVVQFFTTLGDIDEQGKTNDGVARVNFRSDGRSGSASITAFSGATSSSGSAPAPTPSASPTTSSGSGLVIAIGAALPARVIVTADPPRITISRSTHVFALVLDGSGNPVSGVPVIFTVVTSPPASPNPGTTDPEAGKDFMDSGGRPIFTDSNGRAEDVMRTQRQLSGGTAVVKATVLSATAIDGFVNIPVFP